MSNLKRWHCDLCHREWDGYCPICTCSGIGWEMPEIKADKYEFIEDLEEWLDKDEKGGA